MVLNKNPQYIFSEIITVILLSIITIYTPIIYDLIYMASLISLDTSGIAVMFSVIKNMHVHLFKKILTIIIMVTC